MTDQYQVIIVGGGPVGFGLAIELGQRGIRTLVIEKYPVPQQVPKGQNLTQRTMEHFRAWHAEDQLRAAKTVPKEFGIGGLTAYGTLMGKYSYEWMQRALVRDFYATANERLPQYATEAVLRARAAQIGAIDVLLGWEVDELTQDEGTVTVAAFDRKTGDRRHFTCDYAVGADGSRSVTRRSAGITQTTFDHDRLMVLLVFRSDRLHEMLLDRHPGKSFCNVLHPDLEGYWLFFGRVDLSGTFFFHAPVPRGADLDAFDFKPFVERAVGAQIDMEIHHKGFWDCRVAIADNYRSGRIFVAGDAAHNHPPYGGYGINTGFEDARNIGWKLSAVLKGEAGDALLDSYDLERRQVFWSTAKDYIEKSIENDRDFLAEYAPDKDLAAFEAKWAVRGSGAVSEVGMFQPNYRGSPVVWGTDDGKADAVSPHEFRAQAGYHLAPRSLGDGSNVYDHIGDGFSLISVADNETVVKRFQRAAEALKVPLKIIRAQLPSEAADYEARLVLVRPDHFVAWAGNDDNGDARKLLSRCSGQAEAASLGATG